MEEERYYDEYEIDLREYIMLLWDRKWFIIGIFIIAVLGAFLFSKFYLTPSYETEAVIQLSNVDNLYSNPDSVKQILKSTSLVAPVMEEYDLDYSDSRLNSYINNNITVNEISDKQLRINLRNNNPELTLNLTKDIIDEFSNRAEKSFKNYIDRQENIITNLENKIESIDIRIVELEDEINNLRKSNVSSAEKGILINEQINLLNSLYSRKDNYQNQIQEIESEIFSLYSLEILNEPYLPENPILPNIKLNVAIAGVLSLMLGVFIVFFREFLKEDEEEEITV